MKLLNYMRKIKILQRIKNPVRVRHGEKENGIKKSTIQYTASYWF